MDIQLRKVNSNVMTTNNKTHCERSSKSSRLSGPGRWPLPSERNCLKALGFKPHICGTTSTNFFCNNWSRLKVTSSSGATQPRLPSKVLNKSANRLVFSAVGPAPPSICRRRNFVMWAPAWNSARERSFWPFQLSIVFGA